MRYDHSTSSLRRYIKVCKILFLFSMRPNNYHLKKYKTCKRNVFAFELKLNVFSVFSHSISVYGVHLNRNIKHVKKKQGIK